MPEQGVIAERDAQHEGDPAGDSKPLRSLIQLILRTVEGGHVSNLDGLPKVRGTHTPCTPPPPSFYFSATTWSFIALMLEVTVC